RQIQEYVPVCVLSDCSPNELRRRSGNDKSAFRWAEADSGIQEITWAERKEDFCSFAPPTPTKVVRISAVVIQSHNWIVTTKPVQIIWSAKERPSVGQKSLDVIAVR